MAEFMRGFQRPVRVAQDLAAEQSVLGAMLMSKDAISDVVEVLRGVEGVSFTFFESRDVVRHPLVQKIVQAYETYEQKNTPPAGRRRIRERN